MKRFALAVLAALLAWAAPAAAQAPMPQPPPEPPQMQPPPPPPQYLPPPPQAPPGPPMMDPTAHRHLGFYLHMDLGLGGLASSASTPLGDAKLSGTGGSFSIAAGGAVSENFILAGHVWGHTVSDPKVELAGQSATASGSTVSLTGVGLDLTWYLMPSNVYFTVTPSITRLSVDYNGQTSDTESGLGLQLAVGKEWWVSDHWGIGLCGMVAISSNKDKGTDPPTWSSSSFAIAFSATYN